MNFLLHAVPGLADHLRRRRDYERLRDMPDYLLDDIGLSRDHAIRARRAHRF